MRFGLHGRYLALKARIWALRLGFWPCGGDLDLESGIWALRLGFEGGGTEKMEEEKEEKEKIICVKA